MPAQRKFVTLQHTRRAVLTAATAVAAFAAVSAAQLPSGPAKPGFDIARFSTAGNDWFETFHVKETTSLDQALKVGRVAADTRVLVLETAAGKLALLTDQMSFHHIAQGRAGGKDWMATF